ncbi:uncharacterized protein J7T54_008050 [Emericellopsis cladophorae]|uniref:Uncharacterized protein n=1 Tax=Emericellopsis cladophorae TaxID=2686198 RepID=A0A9Q0BHD3_9HYPO|nr:uncharacterized protein J7T54_008050 [Emericellopsis cladophorae]KAI6784956.1 hypothetical protein J7T54_008050 [Emericellopsis cladophorae]
MDRPSGFDVDDNSGRGYVSWIPLVEIGTGQCGTVFALPGSVPSGFAAVAKIPNEEEKFDQLVNDCAIHRRVLDNFQGCDPALAKDINILRVATCVSADMQSF